MTKIINYGELTWPELYNLPKEIPLIFPFGIRPTHEEMPAELKRYSEIIRMPAIPYGWKESGIYSSDASFANLVKNLVSGLKEDGFQRFIAEVPQEFSIDLSSTGINEVIHYQGNRDNNIFTDMDKVIIIPIGHTEQHSHHLPMCTDTLIIDAISKGAMKALPEKCVSFPVMPYGVSMHRSSFFGTTDIGGRAFEDFWIEIIEFLSLQGFDKFFFVNGHGGNSSFLTNIVKYAGDANKRIFCATSYLYLSGPRGITSLEKHRETGIGGMGHACELETSLILHLRPDLVHMEKALDDVDFISTPSYYMDWIEGGALIANPPWEDDSRYGAYGAGSLGTAQKGKIWFDEAIAEKVDLIKEIIEQHRLREIRRISGFGEWGKYL